MAEIPNQAAPARSSVVLPALLSRRWPAVALTSILALAALLRFWGLRFGLPYFEHPDEWAVAEEALRMLRTGDLSPFSYTYPTLYVYLEVGIAYLHFLWGAATGLYRAPAEIDPAAFYVWARALTASLGVGLVGLTYAAGRRLYDQPAGLVAALLLAVLPTAAGDAHYVTVDTPSAFFGMLAFLLIVRLAVGAEKGGTENQEPRTTNHEPNSDTRQADKKSEVRSQKSEYPLQGAPESQEPVINDGRQSTHHSLLTAQIHPGLQAITEHETRNMRNLQSPISNLQSPIANAHQPPAASYQPPSIVHHPASTQVLLAGLAVGLAAATKYNLGVMIVPLAVAVLMAAGSLRRVLIFGFMAALGTALGFTLGVPLWLPELSRILNDLAGIARHYRETGHAGAESSRPWLFYWGALANEAFLVAWAGLGGALLAAIRRHRGDLLVLSLVVPYLLQLSSVRVVFFRNAVPLLPFACLLAGSAMVWAVGLLGADRRNRRTAEPQNRILNKGTKKNKELSDRIRVELATLSSNHQPPATSYQPAIVYRLSSIVLLTLLLIITAQPLTKALRDEWLRAQPTTRSLATDWVLAHAADGTRIWLEDQTLILPARLRVQGGQPVTNHSPEWYAENGFRYMVVNASIAKDNTAALAAFGKPTARFEAAGQRYGHTFLIYDTGVGDISAEPRTPSGATLGGKAIVLDGYNHPATVAPGAVLPLALYWRVERDPGHDYVVFVHLVDAQNTKLAQRDLPPLEGSRPTGEWRAGELIRDDQDLSIPASVPPGRYQLLVGMYDGQTFASINDTGPISIGEVEVRP